MNEALLHSLIDLSPLHAFIGPPEPMIALLALFSSHHGGARHFCPENGVHPYDIADVVARLRLGPPSVVFTFSPLVINEFEGHEVSVVTRDDDGNLCITRLNETKHYVDRRKVYENGELWLAHPDIEGRPDPDAHKNR